MWKLSLPDADDAESDLLHAMTRANGECVFETSADQRAALLQLYQRYDATRGAPSQELLGAALDAHFIDAVYSAYDQVQERRRLAHLRDRLKIGVLECPYCGFGEVTDLDHHLARSVYRAFAIYCRNLVPCCHPCNNKKRVAGAIEAEEQFGHPYFGEYPVGRFLIAEATVSEQAGLQVEFSVVQCEGMADDIFERLTFQFQRLDLNRRYAAQVVRHMADQRLAIELAAENGEDGLRFWLSRAQDLHVRTHGLNDWRAALVDSLQRCEEFCNGGFRHCFGALEVGV